MKNIILFLLISYNIILSKGFIEGYVKDIKTNEPLVGAVIIEGEKGLAATDISGYFSFAIEEGNYFFTASMLGYKKQIKDINVSDGSDEVTIFFYLEPKPIETEKVTVFGKKFSETEKYKTYELNSGDLKNIPVFIESDPIRAVQALPGVTQSHDFSDLVFLRGGNFDETLITLDEVPVYNPHHAVGIYSIFNTDLIDREILYPSNYPVKYGNANAGVLSLFSKDGNRDEIRGIASIGLISSKAYLEGPLGGGSFVVSARRTYPDLIFSMFGSSPYYFYDFNGKYNLPLSNKDLISASFFFSKDIYRMYENLFANKEVEYINDDIFWGNQIGSITYTHLFDNSSIAFSAYFSSSISGGDAKLKETKNEYGHVLSESEHIDIDNQLKDFCIKTNYQLNLIGQLIDVALQYNKISTNYYWDFDDKTVHSDINGDIKDVFFDFAPKQFNQKNNEDVFIALVSDEVIFSSSFSTIIGYRATYLNSISDLLHSPYIRLRYLLSKDLELNASYGRYHQYLFTKKDLIYSTTFAPFTPYFLPESSTEVRSAHQFSGGLKWYNIFDNIDFEIEGYYKTRENIISSDVLTNTTKLVDGYVAGFDALIKKKEGFVTGWVNYSFSRSIKEAEYKYYASYDRTHTLKILINLNLSESWQFNSYWIYASGLPYTPAVGKYLSGINHDDTIQHENSYSQKHFIWELYYGNKNTVRYPAYTRLDIGITGRFIWWGLIAKPYLQVLNVYRSKNAFNYDPRPTDTGVHDGAERGSEIVPTIGIAVEF